MALELNHLDDRWLALQVRVGTELKSARCLDDRGYQQFVPLYPERRRWSDRVKVVAVPLFAGYVFLRFSVKNPNPIVSIPWALRLVGVRNTPMPIEDSEIRSLQIATNAGMTCGPCAFLKIGQEVEIRHGALAGLKGTVIRVKNKDRLILSVSLLMKSVFVDISSYDVGALSGGADVHKC